MVTASARLLRLLSLLSTRQSWTCAQLAEQLTITERTVRRDIARLRELGYIIESEVGPWGGYQLGRGTRMPPLIFDDEEALSVAVGLRAAALNGVCGSDQAALSALLKLRQVLPAPVAQRLGALDAVFTPTPRPPEEQVSPALLLDLATRCRRGERVRMAYRDRGATLSVREIDPYRLVYTGRRWYLVAHDLTRQDWRTFRADRIREITPTGQPADLPGTPDPAAMVNRGMATGPYPSQVTIRLPVPADEALRLVPATVGVHRPDGEHATIVDIGGPDPDGLARYLLALGRPLRILGPDDVRQAFLARTRQLLRDNEQPADASKAGEPSGGTVE